MILKIGMALWACFHKNLLDKVDLIDALSFPYGYGLIKVDRPIMSCLKHRSQVRLSLWLSAMCSEGKSSDDRTYKWVLPWFIWLYYWLFPRLKNFYSSYCSDLTCDQCLRPAGPTNIILKVKLPVVVSFMWVDYPITVLWKQ